MVHNYTVIKHHTRIFLLIRHFWLMSFCLIASIQLQVSQLIINLTLPFLLSLLHLHRKGKHIHICLVYNGFSYRAGLPLAGFPPLAQPLSWATYSNCYPFRFAFLKKIAAGDFTFLINPFNFNWFIHVSLLKIIFSKKSTNAVREKHVFMWVQGLLDKKSVSYYIKE